MRSRGRVNFGFRISDFGRRIPDSGFRISDFAFSDSESGDGSEGERPVQNSRLAQSEIRNPKSEIAPRGFTLLEVLMALVIFALAAVVLGSSYVNVLNGYEVAARGMVLDEDFVHAREQVLAEPDRQKLEQGGDFETVDGRRAAWSVEITSTKTADLFQVAFTCEIQNPGRGDPVKVEQSFMLLRPTWSIDPGERGKLKEDAKTRILELQGKQKK